MGFTALFAKLIHLHPEEIMLGRGLIAAMALGLFMFITKQSFYVNKGSRWAIGISGVCLVTHWVTFFHSVQISSVAIGMISLYTFPVISSILEPVFFREKIRGKDIVSAGFVFLGIWIIAPSISLSDSNFIAILFGLLSATLYAARNIMSRRILETHSAATLMFYHCVIVSLVLSPLLVLRSIEMSLESLSFLLLFGTVFTAFAHTIWVSNFKYFKVTTTGIISCLAPVMGALIAIPLFGEGIDMNLVLGGGVILLTSVYEIAKA